MEKNGVQFLFMKHIYFDSVIQLKNGRILFYNFKDYDYIHIYNEKTFQKILDVNLFKLIKEYKSKREENELKINNDKGKIKISIKELYNSIILIGYYNYIIELNLYGKTYDNKVVKELDDIILEINELSDKRIIAFSFFNIIVLLKNDKEEYMIIEKYKIKDKWKISLKGYKEVNQYFLSDELSNNRLLIRSFIIATKLVHGLIIRSHSYELKEFSYSKIIFIDTNNFEEIKTTKIFDEEINHIIIENYIIIQTENETLLYDINSLELIKNIEFHEECGFLYKFDNKYLFSHSQNIDEKSLTIYKIEKNKFIKQFEIESIFFNYLTPLYFKWIDRYNKYLFVLKDKRIIIISFFNEMVLLKLPLDNLS